VANSKQQAKRVRTAARQRLENLRYKTQIKTLQRRLREAVDAGDGEQIAAAHLRLVSVVDRAAARRSRSIMLTRSGVRRRSSSSGGAWRSRPWV